MAIGVAVGVALALITGGRTVLAGIEQLPLGWFLGALSLSVASWFGQGIGFAALTEKGVTRSNIRPMTTAFLGGDFPALVSPFGSGGIPGGIFCLTREGLSAGEASAVVTMHSLLTGAFFVVVGGAAAVWLPLRNANSSALVWAGFGAIVAGVAVVAWVALRPRGAAALLCRLLSGRTVERILGRRGHARWSRPPSGTPSSSPPASVSSRATARALALSFAGLFASRICLVLALPVDHVRARMARRPPPLMATAVGAMALAVVSPTPGGQGAVETAPHDPPRNTERRPR